VLFRSLLPRAYPIPYGLVGARSLAWLSSEQVSAAISRVMRMAVLLEGAALPCEWPSVGAALPCNYVNTDGCLWGDSRFYARLPE